MSTPALTSPYRLFALHRHAEGHGVDDASPDLPGQSGVLGQFIERGRREGITRLCGYADQAARARDAQEGEEPLLLQPLYPDSGITLLPAVDPVAEPSGAQGLAVAHLFPVAPDRLADCAQAAEAWFVHYAGYGVTEAGILASPGQDQLVSGRRTPALAHLVWLGVLRDEAALSALAPMMLACAAALGTAGLLAAPAELLILEPAPRSRLRWIGITPAIARVAA